MTTQDMSEMELHRVTAAYELYHLMNGANGATLEAAFVDVGRALLRSVEPTAFVHFLLEVMNAAEKSDDPDVKTFLVMLRTLVRLAKS